MNYQTYINMFFAQPKPEPRFGFLGFFQVALFFQEYKEALEYYTKVLGPPAYVEGKSTNGWKIGNGWLTLFPAKSGNPQNIEFTIHVSSTKEAELLQRAFIEAGVVGESPTDELMYEPIRYCHVKDPFGTEILIISKISN